MKKIFKLLPVALGLIALASCSSDDLFNEGGAVAQIETQGDAANVGVEDLYSTGITRSAHTASKALKWVTGDQFRIYDAELSKFDTYEFSAETSAFTRKYTTQRVANDAITYAVFPGENVSWTNFDEATGDVKVVMTIPTFITYNGNSEKNFDGTLAYVSNLPMTGAAQYDETYGAKVPQMKYMTAVLAVTLDNAQSKATWLKLSADKPLSGNFEAVLKDEAVLTKSADAATIVEPKNYIYVNIADAPRSRAIVYLPVIVDTYESLKVEYTTADSYTVETIEAADTSDPSQFQWKTIKNFATPESPITTTRGGSKQANSVLDAAFDFQLDTHTPEALTTVLSDRRDVTGALNLNIDYLQFSKTETESSDAKWYTIKVPNMKADEVHIKMPTGIDNNTKNRSKLVIADADATNPYTGKIILDLESATTGINNDVSGTALSIEVNLKEAAIDMVGDWNDAKNFTLTKARAFQIGDGATTTTFNGNAEGHVVKLTDITESMTITAATNVTGNLSIPATSEAKKSFLLNINGTVSGQVNAVYANTTVTGLVTSYLYTNGDVTIEQATGDDAVGTLRLNGNNQNIYLKKGNIGNIDTGVDANSKYSANLYNEETGKTTIGAIKTEVTVYKKGETPAADANYKMWLKFKGSKWFGEKATKYVATGNIYTASQLAGIDGTVTDGYKLWNDIDLKEVNWVGVNMENDFDGQGYTIANLNLTQKDAGTARTNNGNGLFRQVSGANKTIKNFTLKNVEWKQPKDLTTGTAAKLYENANIGAVAGIVSAAATFQGITVEDAEFDGSLRTDVYNVGGLIGKASADVTIGGSTAGQENSVEVTIKGYHSLGGLIGLFDCETAATATLEKNTVAPEFTETTGLATGMNSDDNFGKIGNLVGSIGSTATSTVNLKGNTVTVGDKAVKESTRVSLNFNKHKNYFVNGSIVQEQYFTGEAKDASLSYLVGFSANGAILQKNGTAQTNSVGAANANWVSTDSKAWNMFTTTAY